MNVQIAEKIILIIFVALLSVALFGQTAMCSEILLQDDFEAGITLPYSSDKSTAGCSAVSCYDYNGNATKSAKLWGTAASLLVSITDRSEPLVLEFDFFPQNVENDFALVKIDNKAIVKICDSRIALGSAEKADNSLLLCWYRIKLILNGADAQLFVNDVEQASQQSLLPENASASPLEIAVTVSEKNSILVDNLIVKRLSDTQAVTVRNDFTRNNCFISKIVPGEIETGVTFYNYGESSVPLNGRLWITLYKVTGGKEILLSVHMTDKFEVKAGESKTVRNAVIVPSDSENCRIRVAVWDGDRLKPLLDMDGGSLSVWGN